MAGIISECTGTANPSHSSHFDDTRSALRKQICPFLRSRRRHTPLLRDMTRLPFVKSKHSGYPEPSRESALLQRDQRAAPLQPRACCFHQPRSPTPEHLELRNGVRQFLLTCLPVCPPRIGIISPILTQELFPKDLRFADGEKKSRWSSAVPARGRRRGRETGPV
jgi:hypothetical protein